MKSNVPERKPRAAARQQTTRPRGQGRAGWLRLWKALHPDTPPPEKHRIPPPKAQRRGAQQSAAQDYLSSFLCAGFAFTLLVTGCAGPRPLRGGKALTARNPAGQIEQTLTQGENASQATKQDQETVKVRTYTLPAGSRVEVSRVGAESPNIALTNLQTILLSAPMLVVEREETRARTELGAAQKDTARELGAKLSSLKGIVWVGVGLFVFGLASLVWPPLKAVIASVTTSAALMLGGVALMVLPTMVVGNEVLILGIVGVGVGGWFLAHRHGQLRGIVSATTANPPAATPDSHS